MEALSLSLKKMVIQECRVRGVKPQEILDTEPVIGSKGAVALDSLDAVEIVTSIERNFLLKADSMPLKNIFRSYNELSSYISTHANPVQVTAFIEKYQ